MSQKSVTDVIATKCDVMTVMNDAISDFHLFLQYLIQFEIFLLHFCSQQVSLLYLLVQSNVLIFGAFRIEF